MKLKCCLAIGLLTLTTACVAHQGASTPATPVYHEDGSTAVVAPRGLTLGAPLRSQTYFDTFTLYNGDLKIGYHLGTNKKMGMNNLKVIDGNLHLKLDTFTYSLFFPKLEKVTGNIIVTCPPYSRFAPAMNMLETLDLSNLREVGGNIVFQGIPEYNGARINKNRSALDKAMIKISDTGFDSAVFPFLTRVGGEIRFDHAAAFTIIAMPSLKSVAGNISVVSSPKLTAMNFKGLKTVQGEISITNNEALASVDLSNLSEVAALEISDNNFVNDKPITLKIDARLKKTVSTF